MAVHGHICLANDRDVGIVDMKPLRVLSKNIAGIVSSSCSSSMVIDDSK